MFARLVTRGIVRPVSSAIASPAAATTASTPRKRWGQIDGLRALAATLVFMDHASLSLGGGPEQLGETLGHTLGQYAEAIRFQLGTTGVALFFGLSGFLLYQPFLRARAEGRHLNLRSYFARRLSRIIPAYWAALIIVGLITDNQYIFTWDGIVNYFLFMQPWATLDLASIFASPGSPEVAAATSDHLAVFGGNPIQPAWTLGVELSFYLVLPLIAWAIAKLTAARKHPVRVELLLLGGLMLASFAYKAGISIATADRSIIATESWMGILPASIDLFAVGMVLAVLAHRSQTKGWPSVVKTIARQPGLSACFALVLFLLPAWAAVSWKADPANWLVSVDFLTITHWLSTYGQEANVLIVALLLWPAVAAGTRPTVTGRIFNSRVAVWIGLVSYGLYLWHSFVLEEVAKLFEPGIPSALASIPTAAVCYALSLGVAAISWYGLERYALRPAHRMPLLKNAGL